MLGANLAPPSGGASRSACRDAAAAYAAAGWPVFPVRRDKAPLTSRGLLDASAEQDAAARWWTRWPDANVAVRTGAPSRLVVLDVDGQDGADSLSGLERTRGELPDTASVVTPRGGSHFYFRWPGVPVKTTNNVVAPGIDIRADGGYVLVPPSATDAGMYVRDSESPIAPMPDWLLELTRDDEDCGVRRAAPAETWVAMLRGRIPGPRNGESGQRNTSLARLTGHLLRHRVDVDVVAELVHIVNACRCDPPLAACDVDKIIDSIARRELTRRRRQQRR